MLHAAFGSALRELGGTEADEELLLQLADRFGDQLFVLNADTGAYLARLAPECALSPSAAAREPDEIITVDAGERATTLRGRADGRATLRAGRLYALKVGPRKRSAA
jgi:hypothetical protein